MTAALAWVVLPLVFGLASLGCGALLELAAGITMPGPLLLPSGFAVIVVASQFPALSSSTASLAAPLIVALAFAGLALSLSRLGGLRDVWAAVAGLGAFASYAAPVALTGTATFAGYIKLDDTATYLAMLDRVESHGRGLAGLAPSTFEATLATSLDFGYPIGSFAPLGVLQRLLDVDAAWLWQPYLTTLGALLALALYALARPVIASRPLRALAAIVAAQPAILLGYALWGGIKELATALLLATLCASIPLVLETRTVRSVLPLAFTSAAILGVLSVGGVVWLTPLVLVLVLIWRGRAGLAFAARAAAAFLCATAVLAVPAIVAAFDWLHHAGAFTGDSELGNLIRPLKLAQIAGIWPVGDFRHVPSDTAPTYVLIGVVVVAAAGGVFWAWTRRAWGSLAYAGGALVGAGVLYEVGSPWIAGKGLATAAPALVLLGLASAGGLAATGRWIEAGVVALAITGGVAWSNTLAYRDVWLAPQSRLAELRAIGSKYDGQGPALMTEFEPYGARHLLRDLDAEGTSELRRHVVPLRNGEPLAPQAYADIDRFALGGLLPYRVLVLRRSPVSSRPPSLYRLVETRHWYEVWTKQTGSRILEHLPLGNELDPGSVPSCARVLRLAQLPGASRLVAVRRRPVLVLPLAGNRLPAGWTQDGVGSADPLRSATFTTSLVTPAKGTYTVWVGGSFVGSISTKIDGGSIGSVRHQLEWPGQYVELGAKTLGPGTHRLQLRYTLGGWRPGSNGLAPFPLGPVVIAPADARKLISVAPSQAQSLCGQRLDWVEAVA